MAITEPISRPTTFGPVTSFSDLRQKRRQAERASILESGSRAAERAHDARQTQFFEQPTPFWHLAREQQSFSPSRTQSAEDLHHRQRNTCEFFPHSASPPVAMARRGWRGAGVMARAGEGLREARRRRWDAVVTDGG